MSEDMIRINGMLQNFGLTQDHVRNSGIDIEVLLCLPEFELVDVLSDIAPSLPREEAKNVDSNISAQIQGPANEGRNADESRSRITEDLSVDGTSGVRQQNEHSSMDQDKPAQSQHQSEPLIEANTIMPPPTVRDAQVLNTEVASQSSRQREPIDYQLLNAFAAELENTMLGMNAPIPPNQANRPQALNVGGAGFRIQPGSELRSPAPDPFGGLLNAQNVPQLPGARPNIRVHNVGQPDPGVQEHNLPPEIDQEFFNSLPEDCKQELLRNDEMLRRNLGQPPLATSSQANIARAEPMDTASFFATLTDENLRREILIGMDDQTLSTLPPRIQSEARRYQREILRRQYRREQEDPARILRSIMERSAENRANSRDVRGGQDRSSKLSPDAKYDNFMDIIARREEILIKYAPELTDTSKSVISIVF